MIDNDALSLRANQVRRALAKLCVITSSGDMRTVEKGPILLAAEQAAKSFQEMALSQMKEASDITQTVRKSQESSDALRKQIEQAEEDRARLEREMLAEKAAKQASEEERVLLAECEQLRAQIAQLDEKIAERENNPSLKRGQSTESVIRQNELYKKLGLSIRKPRRGQIRIGMALVDPKQPDEEFFFTLGVNDRDNLFEVYEIEPPVSNQEALVEELRKTNELSVFTRKLRCRWKEQLA